MSEVRQEDRLDQSGGTILQEMIPEPEPEEDVIQNPPASQRRVVQEVRVPERSFDRTEYEEFD